MKINKEPLVITIIVHYQSPEECIQLVNDLQSITWKHHKIVIVDNQSGNEFVEKIQNHIDFDNVTIVNNFVNNGYGGGINFGVKQVLNLNANYYQVINADTRIINFDYITKILNLFENNKEFGLIGPRVIDNEDQVQNTIMPFITFRNVFQFKRKFNNFSGNENIPLLKSFEVINGVCFIIKSNIFHEIGGFDEDFFMYGEEHDLCYRIKKAGFDSGHFSSRSILHNKENKNNTNMFTWRDSLIRSNQVLFLKKHRSNFEAFFLSSFFSISVIFKWMTGTKFHDIKLPLIILGLFKPSIINNLKKYS